jgi:hypothetical protein
MVLKEGIEIFFSSNLYGSMGNMACKECLSILINSYPFNFSSWMIRLLPFYKEFPMKFISMRVSGLQVDNTIPLGYFDGSFQGKKGSMELFFPSFFLMHISFISN